MKKQRAFKQHGLTGLCGPYALVNALARLDPNWVGHIGGPDLALQIAQALPVPLATVQREGTDRAQMEAMLAAAQAITHRHGAPPWRWDAHHPQPHETAAQFWVRIGRELARPARAAVVGFGDYHRESAYYEPHWTCVDRITPRTVHLLDSDEYDWVPRSATGIRPECGWEIEDGFLLTAC